jgi:hypothetical protein
MRSDETTHSSGHRCSSLSSESLYSIAAIIDSRIFLDSHEFASLKMRRKSVRSSSELWNPLQAAPAELLNLFGDWNRPVSNFSCTLRPSDNWLFVPRKLLNIQNTLIGRTYVGELRIATISLDHFAFCVIWSDRIH